MAILEKGEIAKYKYNQLRFSHILIKAGEPHVLTSDPWSFLSFCLTKNIPRTRGKNRKSLERAYYFSDLAEKFYKAAEQTPLPAKGTLLYYGMLNLVKCFLSFQHVELETKLEVHGLMLPLDKKTEISVSPSSDTHISIFCEFSKFLGKEIKEKLKFDLKTALSHIPEIHGIFSSLGYSSKPKLLPISIEILTNKNHKKLFSEISYKKEQETNLDISKFEKTIQKYFKQGYSKEGFIVYRSKKQKSYTNNNIHRIYQKILTEYKDVLDVVSILSRQGYRYYIDIKPGDLKFLSYSLAAMFYIGSAARYRPLDIKAVMEGELRPLITELVSITPKQFLYHMVSLITKKECVIPLATL